MEDYKTRLDFRNRLLKRLLALVVFYRQQISASNSDGPVLEALMDYIKRVSVQSPGDKLDVQIANLKTLHAEWYEFVEAYKRGDKMDSSKDQYMIGRALSCIRSMNMEQLVRDEEDEVKTIETSSPPMRSEEDLQAQLKDINIRRERANKRLSQLDNNSDSDHEEIAALQKLIGDLDAEYNSIRQQLKSRQDDSAEETFIDKKIDEAIQALDKDKYLEKELANLQDECVYFQAAFLGTVLLFILGYTVFLCKLPSLHLTQWYEYAPYSMSIPIVIALLWIFVYLKNRANKLCIELSSKLFHLRYLEGMMKMCNRTSCSKKEAQEKIEHIVDSLVKSLLKNIENNVQKSDQIADLEKIELKNTPYFKVVEELKELIKMLKS